MSLLSVIKTKLGQAANTAYNFLLDASAADGTMKLARESGQDIITVDVNGKVSFPQGVRSSNGLPAFQCRAWVNFDGARDSTGAASTANTARYIRASGNVSSVVRVGTGQYVINFATPMPGAYVCFPGGNNGGGGAAFLTTVRAYTAFPRDLNSCGLGHYRTDTAAYDADSQECCVSVFC